MFPQSPWQEFWYPALKPGVNILAVPDINATNRGQHLVDTVRLLQRKQRMARECAPSLEPSPVHNSTWPRAQQGPGSEQHQAHCQISCPAQSGCA